MKKIEPVVYKETANIALWTLILSAVMQAVFLVIGKWDYTVLLGNLLGGGTAVLNFFVMALGVQMAVEKSSDDAKHTLKLSQSMRFIVLFIVVALGAVLKCFNVFSVVIPLLFPRIAIFIRLFAKKKNTVDKEDGNEN